MSQWGLEGQQTLTGFIPSTTSSWLQGTTPHVTEISWASLTSWFVLCDKKESFQQVVYLFHLTFRCQTSVKTEVICSAPAEWAPRWLLAVCHSDIGCGKRDQPRLEHSTEKECENWLREIRALQGRRVPKEPQSEMWIAVCVCGSTSSVYLGFVASGPSPGLWIPGLGHHPQPLPVHSQNICVCADAPHKSLRCFHCCQSI